MNKYKKTVVSIVLISLFFGLATARYCQEILNTQFSGSIARPIIDYSQIIYAVLFLLAMIIAAIFLSKKSKSNHSSRSEIIDIVYNYAISSKDKLLIVKIGEEYLLLGISSSGVRKLHVLDKEFMCKAVSANNIKSNEFSNIMVNLIGRHRSA